MNDIDAVAANFIARRPLFQDPSIPDSAIPRMVMRRKRTCSLWPLCRPPTALGFPPKARIPASTLFVRVGGITEPGRGEWALLKSLLAELQR